MNFLEAIILCMKHKKLVFLLPIFIMVVMFIVTSFLPKYFYTDIRLRVDDPSGTKVSLLDGLGKNLSSYFGGTKQDDSKELFLEILSGRENLVSAIQRFHVDSLYKKTSIDLTLKLLLKDLYFELDENGIIVCGYVSKNKVLAVDFVTFLVDNANKRYINLQNERYDLNNKFLIQKKVQLIDSLDLLNKQLITFYKDNNVVNIEKQIELSLYALSNYEQQLRSFKVEKKFIDLTLNKNMPEAEKFGDRIKILQSEFESLRGKSTKDYQPSRSSVLINTDWAFEKLVFEKVMLNKVEILKDFIGAVSKEQALTESNLSKNIPVVQIIQDAYTPDWKTKPKRAKWAITAFLISFILAISFCMFRAYMVGEIKGDEKLRQKIKEVFQSIRI